MGQGLQAEPECRTFCSASEWSAGPRRASHGISAKYDWNDASSRSEDTNIISKDLPFATMLVYDVASAGVNPRHGGHLVRCIVRAPRQACSHQGLRTRPSYV
jgi:hypothetical protein